MKVIICNDYNEVSEKVLEITRNRIRITPNALISFPGGDTPQGFIKNFVADVNAQKIDISKAKFVSLDEWVGLRDTDEGSCAHFLNATLFTNLKYTFAEKYILNGANTKIGSTSQLIREC